MIYESQCRQCNKRIEWYAPRFASPDPICCGERTERQISTFKIVWTGDITPRYKDKTLEGGHTTGFDVWETKTRDGVPRKRRITNWQEQNAYCKSEGLVNPRDVASNSRIDSEGRRLSGRGLPGQEI